MAKLKYFHVYCVFCCHSHGIRHTHSNKHTRMNFKAIALVSLRCRFNFCRRIYHAITCSFPFFACFVGGSMAQLYNLMICVKMNLGGEVDEVWCLCKEVDELEEVFMNPRGVKGREVKRFKTKIRQCNGFLSTLPWRLSMW